MTSAFSDARETIYAVATGAGRSAVAIVRLSGPACEAILEKMCPHSRLVDRRAVLAAILDEKGELIDHGVVIRFFAPHSFTGEDVVEFQVTGSRAVLAALVRTLSSFATARPAEAGEFAKRAFQNGKRDLAQIEGLASVVEAETSAQLRHAQRIASGELSRKCEEVRERVLRAMALLESQLDFSDVEDAASISLEQVITPVENALSAVQEMTLNDGVAERLHDGMTVVIAGPPNVGKSSLMNALARREVSIVSTIPGTTRDLIEIALEIDGFPVVFVDTAGLRESLDPLEAEGIARARRRCASADLTLWLSSCEGAPPAVPPLGGTTLRVMSKLDLAPPGAALDGEIAFSAKTGIGLDALMSEIRTFARDYFAGSGSSLIGTERQRIAVHDTEAALRRVVESPNAPLEFVAEDLRLAARALSRVVGRIDVEDVLSDIFSRLCVGK